MVLTIDTNILMLLDISINDYYLLALIYHKEKTPTITAEDILNLEKKEFIKDTPDGIILRTKGSNLFKDNTTNKGVEMEAFVYKYRELFPIGVKSGGRLVRGDKVGVFEKFKRFFVKYPEYTQEDILEATKVYIDTKRAVNWSMMVSADYLIEKDKQSQLASYCELIKRVGVKSTNTGGTTKGI